MYNFNYVSGDPFVEAGRKVIIKRIEKDTVSKVEIINLINWALVFYVEKWKGKLNSLFLNSTITQPAFKGKEKEKTIEYFEEVFSEDSDVGFCDSCGRKSKLTKINRTNMPLTGGNSNPNFNSNFVKTTKFCVECVTALFFMPFSIMETQGMNLVFNTQSKELYDIWLDETLTNTISSFESNSIVKAKRNMNIKNQLYYLAEKFSELDDESIIEKNNFDFYHFTNFGATPSCSYLTLPKSVILFLMKIVKDNNFEGYESTMFSNRNKRGVLREEWNNFISKNYYFKKNKEFYDSKKNKYFTKSKKEVIEVESSDIVQRYNKVIDKLIKNESILVNLRYSKVSSRLAKNYCERVLHMNKERVNSILDLADKIAILIKEQDNVKYLYNIEKSRQLYEFRGNLVKLMRINSKNGSDKPLFTTEEFIYKILPDGESWYDCKDLMLIRLYENLHDWMNKNDIEEDTNDMEDII
jgi:CRISPR-associated protein Cst1